MAIEVVRFIALFAQVSTVVRFMGFMFRYDSGTALMSTSHRTTSYARFAPERIPNVYFWEASARCDLPACVYRVVAVLTS